VNQFDADFYIAILEASHDEIYVTDGDGFAVYCNKTFESNYGLTREEIMGKHISFLLDNQYCDQSPLPMVIEQKKEVSIRQKTKMGKTLLITATPSFDENGNISLIVENCRDVTEMEAIKADLEHTKEQMIRYKNEIDELRRNELKETENLIVNNSKMKSIVDMVDRLSTIHSTILISGESGTGKSILAKYIHSKSMRKDGPFITINCAAIPPNLLESELFGYVAGAFTGADKKGKVGLVELASGGTLFLDEIGEVPLPLQAKFLELIQDKRFIPVGSTKSKSIDVRIISATNADLMTLVKAKNFREDLYYRLKVVDLQIPPLRERKEDLKAMATLFLNKYNREYKLNREISKDCLEILQSYRWPGNVRELQHVIEQLVVTVPGKVIEPHDLPMHLFRDALVPLDPTQSELPSLDIALEEIEKTLILKAFEHFGSSYKAAKALHISQSKASRLYRKYME